MTSDDVAAVAEAGGEAAAIARHPLVTFADRYRVGEEIGSGKFASVKRCVAVDSRGECQAEFEVAAKFIRKSRFARHGQKPADIDLEIEILHDLRHPNIIQLVDVFEDQQQVILVFELMKGGELQDYIADCEKLPEGEVRFLLRQILQAIIHMHDKSIVHLDLKPENILLVDHQAQHLKIIDFGISRRWHEKADLRGTYGTPEFIAPEILNYEPIGFGTDLWAVGCIAYTMLFGNSPFCADSKQETYTRITGLDWAFCDDICDISEDARDFIESLLVKDIRKRPNARQCLDHPWLSAYPIEPIILKLDASQIDCDHAKDDDDDDDDKDSNFHSNSNRSTNELAQHRWQRAIHLIRLYTRHWKRKQMKRLKFFISTSSSSRSLTTDGALYDEHDENFLLAALFGAIEEGNLHSIEELFAASRIDPNQCNKHGESLLHYCAGLGQLEIFQYLVSRGADLAAVDDQGDTVIHWAARQNHSHVIRYIYEQTASVETVNKNLETSLHVAARYGHVEAVEQLCKCGANINATDEHGETAILIAVWHGFPKIVHILGEIGADTNTRNKEEETALHVASARGHYECVRCLLDAGANANLRNKNSFTPLHLALKRQHSSVAMLLLKAGADYELPDEAGERAVHYAARYNLVPVCQWLCQTSRCEVNIPNRQGLYPLHLAAKAGHIEIVRTLCLAGSVVDQKDKDSIIPQICAIAQSHNDIADLLTRLRNERQKEEFIAQLTATSPCQPLQRIKLKIFGQSGSGKSTLIESMKCGYFSSWFRRSKVVSTPLKKGGAIGDKSQHISTISSNGLANGAIVNNGANLDSSQTRGIDCQQVYISGVGDLSIWEFSGHPCYYQVYDHFLGDTNCLNAIVFRLSDSVELQLDSIFFWLYFLQSRMSLSEPLLYCGKSQHHAKIILIATHADIASQILAPEELDLHLKDILQKVTARFRHIFDIYGNIFMMDASVAGSAGMKQLKQHLLTARNSMLQELSHSTGFLDSVLTFLNLFRKVSINFPVLTYDQFKDMIRSQINPLASEDHFNSLINQLETMGEIIFLQATSVTNLDLLVLCPRWLTCDIVGTLLPMKDDPNYVIDLNKSRVMGIYSIDEFQECYPEVDALDLLQLLEALLICTQNDRSGDIEYEFPCFILGGDLDEVLDRFQYRENYTYHGVVFHLEPKTLPPSLLTSIFPRVQASLRSELRKHSTYNVYDLHNCFKFSHFTTEDQSMMAVFTLDQESKAIEARFCGPFDQKRDCFFFMQEMVQIIENTLATCLPGFFVAKSYLSPKHLKDLREGLSSYSSSSLMKSLLMCPAKSTANLLRKKAKSDDGRVEERLGDILCFGITDLTEVNVTSGEPTLANELHSSNLSLLTKQKLCVLLDPPESIGRDWCMFGILLGMTDKLPKLDPGANAPLSPTARVIEECVRNAACTIKTLVEKLSELNRFDAIEVILQTAPLLRMFPLSSLPEEGVVYNDESSHTSLGVSTLSHTSSSNLSR